MAQVARRKQQIRRRNQFDGPADNPQSDQDKTNAKWQAPKLTDATRNPGPKQDVANGTEA